MSAVASVKVRRLMVRMRHRDDDAQKPADLWHRTTVRRQPPLPSSKARQWGLTALPFRVIHALRRFAPCLSLAILGFSTTAGAQQLSRVPARLDGLIIQTALARVESVTRASAQRMVVGTALGASLGALTGYGLAQLAHRGFCEGTAQCATYPTGAVHASVLGGALVGSVVGGLIAFVTTPIHPDSRSRP